MVARTKGWHDELKVLYAQAQILVGTLLTVWLALDLDLSLDLPSVLVVGLSTLGLAGLSRLPRLGPRGLMFVTLALTLVWSTVLLIVGSMPSALVLLSSSVVAAALLLNRRTALACSAVASASLVPFALASAETSWTPVLGLPLAALGVWSGLSVLGARVGQQLDLYFDVAIPSTLQLAEERRVRVEIEASRDRAKAAFVEAQRKDAVTALAGGLAHDFNNTLMVILSWVELIKDGQDEPELLAEATEAIDGAATQASSLARQQLKLGRPGSATPEPVDLPAELTRVVHSLRKLLPNNIEVRLDTVAVPAVLAEPSQLQQIILNLAINARDAMPEGGELSFGVGLEPGGGSGEGAVASVVLRVSDKGTGMDEATQAKIFEPFFTTKAKGRGSGLGLASVLALVEQLDGRLSVDSVLGRGTTFEIRLPARPELSALGSVDVEEAELELEGRVLVVENEARVRAFLCKTLTEFGLEVYGTADGDAAMKLIEGLEHLDVLCTDAKVPGTAPARYIEVARRRFPSCQVMVCSGSLPDETMRLAVAAGRYAFLAKPFNREQLGHQLRTLVGASSHS